MASRWKVLPLGRYVSQKLLESLPTEMCRDPMRSHMAPGQGRYMNRLERPKPGTPYASKRAAADGNHSSTASTEITELPCQDLRSSSTGGTAPPAAPSALRQSTNDFGYYGMSAPSPDLAIPPWGLTQTMAFSTEHTHARKILQPTSSFCGRRLKCNDVKPNNPKGNANWPFYMCYTCKKLMWNDYRGQCDVRSPISTARAIHRLPFTG